MKAERRYEILRVRPYFDIRHSQDGRVVSSTRRPLFTLKEIPWYSFLLETGWIPGLLKADTRKISKDTTGNLTKDLLSCDAVPQSTAPLVPIGKGTGWISYLWEFPLSHFPFFVSIPRAVSYMKQGGWTYLLIYWSTRSDCCGPNSIAFFGQQGTDMGWTAISAKFPVNGSQM
jgi:hypothetical protein